MKSLVKCEMEADHQKFINKIKFYAKSSSQTFKINLSQYFIKFRKILKLLLYPRKILKVTKIYQPN